MMLKRLHDFLTSTRTALLIAAACSCSLAFALTLQFAFGVQPCELCLWQRAPFAAAGIVALAAVFARPYARRLLALCAWLFLANAGLALFHSGVERHWWVWHSACTGQSLTGDSIDAMREKLLGTPVTRCDQISWTLFGLSMANLNIAFSLALAVFAGLAARKKPPEQA